LNIHIVGGYLENINWSFMDLKSYQLGVIFNTRTWDPGLKWSLDYFNMMASIFTWDLGSLACFNIMVQNHPWDPSIWLYFLTIRVKENTFLRGVECSILRVVIWGI
jgi:hypothetical protein